MRSDPTYTTFKYRECDPEVDQQYTEASEVEAETKHSLRGYVPVGEGCYRVRRQRGGE